VRVFLHERFVLRSVEYSAPGGMLLLASEGTPSILSHVLIWLLRSGHRLPRWGLEDPAAISRSTRGSDYKCERHALFDGCGQVTRSQYPLTAIQAHVSYTMRRGAEEAQGLWAVGRRPRGSRTAGQAGWCCD
jgi:hypothetical protein